MSLRWGILSTARIAQTQFLPAVQGQTQHQVLAIASRDAARAEQVARAFAIPRAYGSYEALLEDPEIAAIYLPLPNSLHAEWTMRALQAGKHVLCEKPVARRAAEAERMVATARANGVLLMEAFMWRHHAQQARVRALLDGGAIGQPTVIRASFGFPLDPESSNVRLRADLEGGSLMDVGCYPVNFARWVFGAEPVRVSGQQVLDPRLGVDMAFGGVLVFAGGRLALIDSNFRHASRQHAEIAGTEGVLTMELPFRPDAAPGRIEVVRGGQRQVEEVPAENQYTRQADHFAQSIAAGRLLEPAEDGVAQARAIEALYASAAGRPGPDSG